MPSEAIQGLQKQLVLLTSKVDHLDKQVDLIFQDLNVSRGAKIYILLEEISNHLKTITRDLTEGQVSTIKYRIDDVIKSIDYINKRIVQ